MILPEIVKNLYTNRSAKWILEIDDNLIEPFVIQKWLVMNDKIRSQVSWLDKYVFTLPSKMWLTLAWSIIPKSEKQPFVRFIKKQETDDKYGFIIDKIRREFNLSDNDFIANKSRILKSIEKDKAAWFAYYGVEKKYWKEHKVNFELMKGDAKEEKKVKGLFDF